MIESINLSLENNGSSLSLLIDVLEPLLNGVLTLTSTTDVIVSSRTGRKWSRTNQSWTSTLEHVRREPLTDKLIVLMPRMITVPTNITLRVTLAAANARTTHQHVTITIQPTIKVF